MAKRFIFLEICDVEIVSLITGIRELATGKAWRTLVHVTIRGPYHREIPVRQLDRWQHLLARHPVLLEGVGEFQSGDAHVVYLKVRHPEMRRIWWKPDFPVDDFGFNPHITLYEGDDGTRAGRLKDFLKREKLKLLTWDFRVTTYVSDHRDLFRTPDHAQEPFLELVNRRLVRPDILARLGRTLKASDSSAGPDSRPLPIAPSPR